MERQTCDQKGPVVNNAFYDELGSCWYEGINHPITLLRAENAVRNPWIAHIVAAHYARAVRILDVGCGGGLLSNFLAEQGHTVTGIDLSAPSLQVAKERDKTQRVDYIRADALNLPFEQESFDVVCAMDILEHVAQPEQLIAQASRVLKPGGLFFFHTFNRNLLSYLLIIKGVEWFIPNVPKHLHLYSFFIKPQELCKACLQSHLTVQQMRGLHPKFSTALLSLPFTKKMLPDVSFCFSKTLLTGYCGFASKEF